MTHPHFEPHPDLDSDVAAASRQLAEKMNAQVDVVEALFGSCTDADLAHFVELGLAADFSTRWSDPEFQEQFRADPASTIAKLVNEYRPRTQH